MRDCTGGCPGDAHSYVERAIRNEVGDRNGRAQARREELLIDLEIRVVSKAGGSQQLRVCAIVKLADKDIGPASCLFIEGDSKAIDFHKGVDTAIGTHVVEESDGGRDMEPGYEGGSRCCMGPWGAGCESECYEG